jgi:DNA processing protein
MSTQQTELLYLLALLQTPGVGNQIARALIQRCGSAEAVVSMSKRMLETVPGIGPKLATAVVKGLSLKKAEAEWQWCEKNGVEIISYTDAAYPQRLRQVPDFPSLLFRKGKTDLNTLRAVAVVGTRRASAYGYELTRQLVLGLGALNVQIVSGLAYGIDVAAHRAALEAGLPTVGVLGNGLARVYPATHRPLAEKMCEQGALLSELMHDAEPDKENFPKRNRIVAGMVDAVVVVEAAENGGALITADLALGYNRDVYAFPGRVTDAFSAGCHKLIRTNKAGLISSASDLCEALGWQAGDEVKPMAQRQLFLELSADEQLIYDLLDQSTPMGIDELGIQAAFSLSRLSNVLLALELKGLIRNYPGKYFGRI